MYNTNILLSNIEKADKAKEDSRWLKLDKKLLTLKRELITKENLLK